MIALDGSEQSNEAFGFAVAKVLRPGRDRVILLHVLAPGQYEAGEAPARVGWSLCRSQPCTTLTSM